MKFEEELLSDETEKEQRALREEHEVCISQLPS
jgi:hypothetical protein